MPQGKTYVKIASQTLGSDVASITFSNLPQNFTDLKVVFDGYDDNQTNPQLQFNGDTGSNYSYTWLGGSGSAAASGRGTSTSFILWGALDNVSRGNAIIDIMNYSNGSTYKTLLIRGNETTFTSGQAVSAWVGMWRNTAAITSITFLNNSTYKYKSGSTFTIYGIEAAKAPKAVGGDIIVSDGSYWYHAFKNSGAFTAKQNLTCDYLLVAGGGCGGGNGFGSWGYAGGGGAGGLVYSSSQSITSGIYAVTVGAGGSLSNGNDSSFNSTTATGGGRGGYYSGSAYLSGATGGSGGGGGSSNSSLGGSGTGTQGNAGGQGDSADNNGGGGGGAGGTGYTGQSSAGGNRGLGGVGSSTYSSWGATTGTGQNVSGTYYYAGGGGGMKGNSGNAGGGSGGGGAGSASSGTAATSGTANTGGGGGGAYAGNGQTPGLGGSGIVIVRYPV